MSSTELEILFQVDRAQLYQVDTDQKTQLLASGLLHVSRRTLILSQNPIPPASSESTVAPFQPASEVESEKRSLTFLQIDHFNIPLFSFLPVLRCGPGHYLIPVPGSSYYVLLLHPETPSVFIQKFEEMVCEVVPGLELTSETSLFEAKMTEAENNTLQLENALIAEAESQGKQMTRQQSWVDSLTFFIEAGSVKLSTTISGTAQFAGHGIQLGGGYLQRKLQPAAEPTKVNPTIKKTLEGGRVAAQTVQAWTGLVTTGVTDVAHSTGKRVISSLGLSKKGDSSNSAMSKIARSGLIALDQISTTLYDSGVYLLDELSSTTTQVVKHKYGEEAAIATEQGLGIATDVTKSVMAANKLSYTAVLKTAAKSGVKEALVSKKKEDVPNIEEIELSDKGQQETSEKASFGK